MFRYYTMGNRVIQIQKKDHLGWSPIVTINTPEIAGHENDYNYVKGRLIGKYLSGMQSYMLMENPYSNKENKRIITTACSLLPMNRTFKTLYEMQEWRPQ